MRYASTVRQRPAFGAPPRGACLPFDPVLSCGRPVCSQRVEFDVIVPGASHSSSHDINPGSGFRSINRYRAGTWPATPNTAIGGRLNDLYNFSDSHRRDAAHPGLSSDKAGQAAWLDFTTPYTVNPALHAGLNGRCLQQLSNDTCSFPPGATPIGNPCGDTGKAEVFAIGPGLFRKAGARNTWFVNLYDQVQARKRARGTVLNVHRVHPF